MSTNWYEEKKGEQVTPGPITDPLLRERLKGFYSKHNCDKLHELDGIIQAIHENGQDAMHQTMVKKYGESIWNKAPPKPQPEPQLEVRIYGSYAVLYYLFSACLEYVSFIYVVYT